MTPKPIINHFYASIPGWFYFQDLYENIAASAKEGDHYVEVGAWKGRSTAFLATEIANSGKRIQFDVIDTWEGSKEHLAGGAYEDQDVINGTLFETFKNNMRPVEGYYNPIRTTSLEAAKQYQDNSLDFVLLDASHSYEDVREDIIAWLPKVKVGGILAGDDYHYSWPGVIKAVDELIPDADISPGYVNYGSWSWIKKAK